MLVRVAGACARLAEGRGFQMLVMGVILFNALLMGLETSRPLVRSFGPIFSVLNALVQAVFVAEILIRFAACWPRPLRFFRDGWNLFDLTVVVLSLLPVAGPFATVSRLARLLRVTRLVSVSPDLRLIVSTMLRSIPSMGHVALLLFVLVYVYAILGYYIFHPLDPAHWGTLPTALLSVFQLITLEGWVEMQQAVLPARPWSWLYFVSFVIVGVFIVINLFIAVVLNNLETVKAEEHAHAQVDALRSSSSGDGSAENTDKAVAADLLRRVAAMRAEMEAFESLLREQQQQQQAHESYRADGARG